MRRIASGIVALWLGALPAAQGIPNLSGTWSLDMQQTRGSERPPTPLTRYEVTIRHTATDITVANPAARWGAQPVVYALDGQERVVVDGSLGELPNFVRKLRIRATSAVDTIMLRTTPFGEQTDPPSGSIRIPAGAITDVQVLRMYGDLLYLDTTAFREVPPAVLHGQRYQSWMDDGLRRGYTEVFRRRFRAGPTAPSR